MPTGSAKRRTDRLNPNHDDLLKSDELDALPGMINVARNSSDEGRVLRHYIDKYCHKTEIYDGAKRINFDHTPVNGEELNAMV